MIENDAIEISLNSSVDHIPNQIETINRIGTPRVATGYNSNETIRFFSTNHASESLKNISNQILFDKEIKTLVSKNFNLFSSSNDNRHHDFIEWSLFGRNLTKKRAEFREQIDLYKTYNNQHHSVTKMVIEITSYYLDEYLISQECFSQDRKDEIKFYFQKSIEEQNYLKRFIQVYTSSTIFHRILNKHLASYILDYFHIPSYSSSPTKYRLINCLVHIVTLVINHPDIHLYEYKGITYRGLLATEDELQNYYLNNQVLNRSFLSTSTNRTVALTYAGYRDKDLSEDTLDNQNSTQISVLFKFLIKQNRTVFEVKRRRKRTNKNSTMLIEIDLEECVDDAQIEDTQRKMNC
ncbi:hypothetical protein I4U23_015903 [Adineta vaga]|nr:hypothetical protein I4U23_015903 [Adineta vaga]